jgi:hypothetical protein
MRQFDRRHCAQCCGQAPSRLLAERTKGSYRDRTCRRVLDFASLICLQFGKNPRTYEVRENHRFFRWVLEQIVDNVNQYKHGFDVTVSVKRCSNQMTRGRL